MDWTSYFDGIASLFDQGGLTLKAILFASLLLWALIAERYWFHWRQVARVRSRLAGQWGLRQQYLSQEMMFRRLSALVGELRAESDRNLLALQSLTVILPLLGLLGTVSGMIKVFEVITVFGTGNTRGMASGISEALVTTMAGLFTALSGFYFISDLQRRSERLELDFEAELLEAR